MDSVFTFSPVKYYFTYYARNVYKIMMIYLLIKDMEFLPIIWI